MKTLIGRRYPRLFFTDEEGEPFYFKEEAVMPAVPPPYPKIVTVQGMTSRDHNFSFVNNAMDAGGLAPGTRISDRNIATWELSKFLGVSDIIIPVERGSFTFEGEKLDGIKMPPAAGVRLEDLRRFDPVKGYRMSYTVPAVRQLTVLLMFDYLCAQLDRHKFNIKLICDMDFDDIKPPIEGADMINVLSILAIDHDLSFGVNDYKTLKKHVSLGLCVCPELMGKMQYTAIDEPFYDRICAVSDSEYEEVFDGLLTADELAAFFDRLRGFKAAIDAERENEAARRSRGEEFFSRFVSIDEDYAAYLSHMETAAANKSDNWDMRFSHRPTYLERFILQQRRL